LLLFRFACAYTRDDLSENGEGTPGVLPMEQEFQPPLAFYAHKLFKNRIC